ncbi:GPI mannosyltransferase [Protomyces lactucae-debilis]|uniref:Mannosyltransferase n=1 Tax=Protomyces lactucae-debilis TaxID=2754530 RepID=A0A1Y2FRX5_PROLT|nr:GPI mannosyltransferase [Protomyces lactucae-debilis]ORY85465.1 GPI mannosyltransferase [Protomyces lactucae-debilis]
MGFSWLFGYLLLYRLFNALFIRTFFQPDEYYQSIEPAHVLVYKYGFLPWEYRKEIRSIAHPLLFAIPFKLMQLLGLDSSANLLMVPKLLGALQAAVTDFYTVRFVHKTWSRSAGWWALLVTVLSPWNFYVLPRTFSSSLETSLTAYALYKWPFTGFPRTLGTEALWSKYVDTVLKGLGAIGAAVLIRPTTALLWLVPGLRQLRLYGTTFAFEAFYVAYVTLQFGVIIDSFYYGRLAFPLLNFLKFNLGGHADFYGVNQVHYYLSQGLPLLMCAWLPFAIHGAIKSRKSQGQLLAICATTLAAYTMLRHKEARFIAPLVVILNGFAAYSLSLLSRTSKSPALKHDKTASTKKHRRGSPAWFKVVLALAAVVNISLGYYATRVHQRGVMDLIEHVRRHPEVDELLLLMPCHSTPWQSHIHRQGNFRFLTCEPPLGDISAAGYRDEADQFYDDPMAFLAKEKEWSGWVATFEASQQVVEQFWTQRGVSFEIEQRWFNTHGHDDARRRGDVLLYRIASASL